MALRSLAKSLSMAVLFGTVITVRADTPAPAPTPAPQHDAGGAAVIIEIKLTGPEMSERVGAVRVQVDVDYQHVQHLATIARKLNDIIKLTCVDNKIVEIKAEMNILDTVFAQFTVQLQASADQARASYLQVDDLGTKIHALRGDADVCAGVVELTKQESGNTSNNPLFPDDPTQAQGLVWQIEPPQYASPFN
jgi:hypothetical protein